VGGCEEGVGKRRGGIGGGGVGVELVVGGGGRRRKGGSGTEGEWRRGVEGRLEGSVKEGEGGRGWG